MMNTAGFLIIRYTRSLSSVLFLRTLARLSGFGSGSRDSMADAGFLSFFLPSVRGACNSARSLATASHSFKAAETLFSSGTLVLPRASWIGGVSNGASRSMSAEDLVVRKVCFARHC